METGSAYFVRTFVLKCLKIFPVNGCGAELKQ
jgi:hypothetical protein